MSNAFDDMLAKDRGRLLGTLYGYPECCIEEHMVLNASEVRELRGDHPLLGTGYVPCEKCWNKPADSLISEINKKRHKDLKPFEQGSNFKEVMEIVGKYYT